MSVRTNLHVPRLILQVLKLTTIKPLKVYIFLKFDSVVILFKHVSIKIILGYIGLL
jgi:hypothetical protein